MIKSIKRINNNKKTSCPYTKLNDYKIEIDSTSLNEKAVTIEIVFNDEIEYFRNYDYKWVKIKHNHISNQFSPKLIKLKNNQIIQSNQQQGIWEVRASRKKELLWHINPPNSKPIVNYNNRNSKQIVEAFSNNLITKPLGLLFVQGFGIEISRSKIPFSAIACFTDHCDFDTLNNLKQQRRLFKKYDIKVTKGFFLNHYSKRRDTASFEYHEEELKKWLDDGHELAYHSLSQSIKSETESNKNFKQFEPPLKDIETYIDHGFQPYNLSLYKRNSELCHNYGAILKEKKIKILWNYVDTGTAVKGVINQINPSQFTLNGFCKGIRHFSYKVRVQMFIKCTIFHYYNNDKALQLYRSIAQYYKTIKRKKKLKRHLLVFTNVLKLIWLFIPIGIFWNSKKDVIFPLSKYTPLVFNHVINRECFTVFQTLEMIDFKIGLCKKNIDLLIKESGLFIAHTYFSAPMNYHQGKLFGNVNEIDIKVEENFKYLSEKIIKKNIWNPTLTMLVNYLEQFQSVSFNCGHDGKIYIENQNELLYRKVE